MKRKACALGMAAALVLLALANTGCRQDSDNGQTAKYVFLFIGDGMGATHVAATESYLSYKKGVIGGEHLNFTRFPVYGMTATYSANNGVTCSSAAGTAIACGEKTNNKYLGVNTKGEPLESIASVLKGKGYKTGILSTVPINHATPAAFYAHTTNRYGYYDIMKEIPASEIDFLCGSGFLEYYGKDGSQKGSDELLEDAGYTVSFGYEEYLEERENAQKMILCQKKYEDKDAADYSVYKPGADDFTPAQAMDAVLGFFGDEEPFFIMYEGGEIDWSAHMNKTMPLVTDIIRFDSAVAKAIEFYKAHPEETLIIVTADHETGGITLGSSNTWDEKAPDWRLFDSLWVASDETDNLEIEEERELNKKGLIGWTTLAHTGGPVPVYAIGKGAERFAGLYQNSDIKNKILSK